MQIYHSGHNMLYTFYNPVYTHVLLLQYVYIRGVISIIIQSITCTKDVPICIGIHNRLDQLTDLD